MMAIVTLNPTAIRTDLVTRLSAADTVAETRVYDSRRVDLDTEDLPAIVVNSLGHKDEQESQSTLLFKRVERLQITGLISASDDPSLAAAIDSIEDEILTALIADEEWNRSFEAIGEFTSDKSLDLSGKKRVGGVGIQFTVQYHVTYAIDLTSTDRELHEVVVTTDTTEPDKADVSERSFAVEVTP